MAEFRFRAAAALELRHADERTALRCLSHEEGRFHEAERAVEAAHERRLQAQTDLVTVERRGSDGATLFWHRNWIVRLTADLVRLRSDLDDRAVSVKAARQAWQDARRRRLVLERMKERALRRFRQAELRQEMKALDELARLRHVMADHWRHEL